MILVCRYIFQFKFVKCPILKGEFGNILIGPSDAPKFNIIWTDTKNFIDRFLPDILMFKECSKRFQHVFDIIISLEGSDKSNFRFHSK